MRTRIALPVSIAAALLALLSAAVAALLWDVSEVPAFESVRSRYESSDALVVDRNGVPLQEIRIKSDLRRLRWIPIEEVSPALVEAVLQAEDRRFFEHGGMDGWAIAAALSDGLRLGVQRGGSTVTMQLASLLDEKLQPDGNRRSLLQKLHQVQKARGLERKWDKRRILEAYLNLVSFRGELQGVDAASKGLFQKDPHGLVRNEALILAALLRAPNARAEAVAARAERLAKSLESLGDTAALRHQAIRALSRPYRLPLRHDLAPHAARQVLRAQGIDGTATGQPASRVVTTLDAELQRYVIESLRRQILSVRSENVQDGAVLVIKNRSGEVRAYVGSSGSLSDARHVDGIQARRQAGSTLKPFLYATALEEKLLTPASLIEDSPLEIMVQGGIYRPRNYDKRFNGLVTVREALASSLNVPAVRTLSLVGLDPFLVRLRNLGFQNLREADHYGPSLALGSADVSLWDLSNAYRTLANDGHWTPLRLMEAEKPAESLRVFQPEAAYLISDILSDRESRSRTFQLESPLATRFWTAVKTGTSKDMRDNWCVGYSSEFTVGVWIGNFSGDSMWNVSGVTGAAPIWVEVMEFLHRGRPSRPSLPPQGLREWNVAVGVEERKRREWFLEGTEQARILPAPQRSDPEIIYPPDGTVIALDPDIPEPLQRVFFEAVPPLSGSRWILNGIDMGPADQLAVWSPIPGEHLLQLRGPEEGAMDQVHFIVRGGPMVEAPEPQDP